MAQASRTFQIFAKPVGRRCNLACDYCYYRDRSSGLEPRKAVRMADDLLELYIRQHIAASPDPVITFSWHGGEPTLLGLDFFRRVVALQRQYQPTGRRIVNGLQTNGILLDDDWCRFLARESFVVGLSLDGPQPLHDVYRHTRGGRSVFPEVLQGFQRLVDHGIPCDILCVVNAVNVGEPLGVYRFFKGIGATQITLLPLVESMPDSDSGVSERTVPAAALGEFLCAVFDEWLVQDIETIRVNIFEEIAHTAFGQQPALCVFRETCGDVSVIEQNGDFFCCDHFVRPEYHLGNIRQQPLIELLESERQKAFGQAKRLLLPAACLTCDVLTLCRGGCPKDRLLKTVDGQPGLNFLCQGYQRFFRHCRPFLQQLSRLAKPSQSVERRTEPSGAGISVRTGRNDPCPCGSGKKFKKCCLNRR